MNWDQVKGICHRLKGSVRAKWGELTDDEIADEATDQQGLERRRAQDAVPVAGMPALTP